jgi:spermidine/putrescine transport system substrate-binding protein
MLLVLSSCSMLPAANNPTPTPQHAQTLRVYGWAGYMPDSILAAFTKEYGVTIIYEEYEDQDIAIEVLRAGEAYDVVVMGTDLIPKLINEQLLSEIDYRNVPNFKNVSANFRDLAYDPGNKHSFLIQWGNSGLLTRTDLVQPPITRWADLWRPELRGKIGLWSFQRELTGIALKSLGYSANSEDPQELNEAFERLATLKQNSFIIDGLLPSSAPHLLDGSAYVTYGWPLDLREAQKQNTNVNYILPEEGSILWGDNVVIPTASTKKATAELFLDFLLRPEISGQMTNETFTATPNEAARAFVLPELLNDPSIFPTNEDLKHAELILPLSERGEQLHNELWHKLFP